MAAAKQRLNPFFCPKAGRALRLLLYAALGALSFFIIYGSAPLDVSNEGWILSMFPERDIAQNYAGWMAYRAAPEGFPLTYIDAFCWPEGIVIARTDSSPLINLILKPFAALMPGVCQWFGWQTFCFYILQGLCAGMLVELYTQKLYVTCPAVLLFTFSPIMMERAFRHVGLSAHFILLLALYLYLRARRQTPLRLPWQFLPLSVLDAGITPYYMPMVMAVIAALAFEYWRRARGGKMLLRALGFITANFAVSMATAWLFGMFGFGVGAISRWGFGHFSMNLNALFNPSSLGDYTWSFVIPKQTQIINQYDGFNYLGLGVLAALCFVGAHWGYTLARQQAPFLKSCRRHAWRFVRLHAPILFICLCLTAFAITHKVSFTARYMIELPLPEVLQDLAGIFRASARMFYLVYYALYLFVLRYALRRFTPHFSVAFILALTALQLLDLGGVVSEKHRFFKEDPPASILTDQTLLRTVGEYGFLMAADRIPTSTPYYLAAKNGIKTNHVWVNSGSYPRAEALYDGSYNALLAGTYDRDTAYMVCNDAQTHERADALKALYANGADMALYESDGILFLFPLE